MDDLFSPEGPDVPRVFTRAPWGLGGEELGATYDALDEAGELTIESESGQEIPFRFYLDADVRRLCSGVRLCFRPGASPAVVAELSRIWGPPKRLVDADGIERNAWFRHEAKLRAWIHEYPGDNVQMTIEPYIELADVFAKVLASYAGNGALPWKGMSHDQVRERFPEFEDNGGSVATNLPPLRLGVSFSSFTVTFEDGTFRQLVFNAGMSADAGWSAFDELRSAVPARRIVLKEEIVCELGSDEPLLSLWREGNVLAIQYSPEEREQVLADARERAA